MRLSDFEGMTWFSIDLNKDKSIFHHEEGFDKKMLLKRVRAFEKVLFPVYARKINNCDIKMMTATSEVQRKEIEAIVEELIGDLAKRLRPLINDILEMQNGKAFYELRKAVIDFCILTKILLPIPLHDEYQLMEEVE